MVEITGTYAGDLRVEARHGPSGAELATDAPVDHEGLGRSFSPTDLVATALGACILTVVGIVARRRGVDVAGARFSVTKEMVSEPKRRIGRLATTVHLPAAISAEDRVVLERAAHTCPVHQSLAAEIEAPITFIYA
jgi:putative redox protein